MSNKPKVEFKCYDLVLPLIAKELSSPCRIQVSINERSIRLWVGPRDWQWDRETGELIGAGTCITDLPHDPSEKPTQPATKESGK